MYKKDRSPQGLYIEHGEIIEPIDTITKDFGNFYLQPNGIFYISNQNQAFVKQTQEFSLNQEIKFATQSGPMLVVDGKIHPKFKQGSTHLNIRNGVGVLPNGQVLFAISKEPVSLFDFASFFLQNDCEQALYLDGFVSRAYYPEKNINDDGDFGVIIAVNE